MTEKFFNSMGLCRRAKKLCIGHDEVKASVKSGKAKLILLTADASPRLEKEINNLTTDAEIIRVNALMEDMGNTVGKPSGIFSVTDEGLKELVLRTIREDSTHGTNQ